MHYNVLVPVNYLYLRSINFNAEIQHVVYWHAQKIIHSLAPKPLNDIRSNIYNSRNLLLSKQIMTVKRKN